MYDSEIADLNESLMPGMRRPGSKEWMAWRAVEERHAIRLTRVEQSSACRRPKEWDLDPTVCANDGRLIADHDRRPVPPMFAPYEQALMTWMVRHGGIPNYSGTYAEVPTVLVRKHILEDCSLALPDCVIPTPTTFTEFGDTENDTEVSGLEGELTCECGKVSEVAWAIKQPLTLGEVMYQVIREGARRSMHSGVREQ